MRRASQSWQARQSKKAEEEQKLEFAKRTPTERDSPQQILEKLALNDIRFPLKEAKIELHGHSFLGFIILQDPQDEAYFWISPSILLKPKEKINPEEAQYQDKRQMYLTQTTAALNRNARELANVLGEASEIWDIVWNREGSFTNPKRVHKEDLKDIRKSSRSYVEVE